MRFFISLCCLLAVNGVLAADSRPIFERAAHYARTQAQGLGGKVSVEAGPLDTSRLPDCAALEPYPVRGARLFGHSYVGIRCLAPHRWSILVPVRIAILSTYVASSRSLLAGQSIEADDIQVLTGDLGSLPSGVVSEPATALGKTLRNSIGPGQAIRRDQLLAPLVIKQGQTVRVISQGPGFSVSGEGKAINNAAEGDIVQVRMPNGQTISGSAQNDGSVDLSN
ncbi:MAG: flagellar basal body P-ring formation chaperone FlgA [Dechloromonas sp.]|nr:flagellar basal body P-ring formation chaperone FlgA [Dechloromonas sp.]